MSLADDLELRGLLHSLEAGWELPTNEEVGNQAERDRQLAEASRRWRFDDDGFAQQSDTQFVPGDLAAIRWSIANQLTASITHDDAPNRDFAIERVGATLRTLYGATPYWLDADTAWSVMAIKPLTSADRAELRLARPALVLFAAGKEITDPYLALPEHFATRLDASLHDTPTRPSAQAPASIRAGTLATLRWQRRPDNQLYECQLLGVLITPSPDGAIAEPTWWILRRINPPPGATTETIVTKQANFAAGASTFYAVEGRLSRATLAPIAEALAAVISWGRWHQPEPWTDPEPPSRKAARKSAFKKAEQRGQILQVRTLQPLQEQTNQDDKNTTGRTAATHWRAGHWQRYRVGPSNDWSYIRRRKPGQIINPGNNPITDQITMYRLPPPPV